MKRLKIYLDSSVLGCALNREDVARYNTANILLQQISQGILEGYISAITRKEIEEAPEWIRELLEEVVSHAGLKVIEGVPEDMAQELAQEYIRMGIIPENFVEDALHIAIASLSGMDALVSFNLRHIVRLEVMIGVNEVNRRKGVKGIFLCQPMEVIQDV